MSHIALFTLKPVRKMLSFTSLNIFTAFFLLFIKPVNHFTEKTADFKFPKEHCIPRKLLQTPESKRYEEKTRKSARLGG